MCGIAGQVSRLDPASRDVVLLMSDVIEHRGPDDEGFWSDEDQRVAFGHRRLSIIDLSELGHQPMCSPDGRFVIVYNGEIYNFAALRKQLEATGERFVSTSDTEVLLRLWALKGADCLLSLRGMFAFAVWDRNERVLSLIRDPLGIKPLYFSHNSDSLSFASEMKALRAARFGDSIDPAGVGAFLRWGSVPPPLTLYRNIRALPAASVLTWKQSDGATTIKSYWDFNAAWSVSSSLVREIKSRAGAVEWVRTALQESVRSHLVSDVPVGAFLSGGIDSTAVVSLMRQAGQNEIKTFSIGSDESSLDESEYGRIAAREFETGHHEWNVAANDFAEMRRSFFEALDQPTIDGFNVFLVSKLAHQHGMKVVTSGIGGDEIFRGYDMTFRRLPVLRRFLRFTPAMFRLAGAAAFNSQLSKNRFEHKSRRLASLLRAEPGLAQVYLWARELFTSNDIRKMFASADFGAETAAVDMTEFLPQPVAGSTSELANISMLEARRYLGTQLLADSDNFSMAHSLELRVPLVDRQLYEQLLALGDKYYGDVAGTPKSLLVAAVGDLPDNLVKRKKQGFTLPFQKWLASESRPFRSGLFDQRVADEVLSETRQQRRHWSSLWAMLVLDHFLAGQLS